MTAYPSKRTAPQRKGATVVAPSDFQIHRPKSPINTAISNDFPHGYTHTLAHRHTLAQRLRKQHSTPMRVAPICAKCAKTMRRQTQRARAYREPRSATHLPGSLYAPTRCVKSGVRPSYRPPGVFVGYRCNSLPR